VGNGVVVCELFEASIVVEMMSKWGMMYEVA